MKMLKKAQSILQSQKIDAWFLLNAENRDPYYMRVISPHTNIQSVALITPKDAIVFVHTLDVDNLESLKSKIKVIPYNASNPLDKLLLAELEERSNIKKIALNYSTMNDVNVDILGYGFYRYFTDLIKNNIKAYKASDPFISAEGIVYALSDRKDNEDLHKLSIAAKRANQILNDAFKRIKPGMTEIELVDLVHEITQKKPAYFEVEGVIDETYSWEEEACPIALTGPSFIKGGHALSGETKVEEGFTVYFDFGVKLSFKDGSHWSSDLQRTGYVLRKDETKPPGEIINRFNTIIEAITEGINKIKPGIKGYVIDEVVRNYILNKGYPDYDHATGHAIGELAHNPGTILSSSKSKLANLDIQPNGVYTIEPRIPVHNGVSIEEMIVVYDDKPAQALCERQTKPILIRP